MCSYINGIRQRVSDFSFLDQKIERTIHHLSEMLNNSSIAKNLEALHFLTTSSPSGGIVITCIYSALVTRNSWLDAIKEIKMSLMKVLDLSFYFVGRSKGQLLRDGEESNVVEYFDLGENRTVQYIQNEGVFSNPNGIVNLRVLKWLISVVKAIPENSRRTLLELYSGNCNHSIALAPLFKSIISVEIEKELCNSANQNIRLNRIDNIKVIQQDAGEFFAQVAKKSKMADVLIVDPPRKGVDKKILEGCHQFNTIIYISCHPKSIIGTLKEAFLGSHEIIQFAVVDHFPFTRHTEVALIFRKRVLLKDQNAILN